MNSIEEPYALIAHVRFREGCSLLGCNIALKVNHASTRLLRQEKLKNDQLAEE